MLLTLEKCGTCAVFNKESYFVILLQVIENTYFITMAKTLQVLVILLDDFFEYLNEYDSLCRLFAF